MIDRAIIEAEKADAIRQRDAAQQAINEAQQQILQAQQRQQQSQAALLVASGAIQQCDAFLALDGKALPEQIDDDDVKELPKRGPSKLWREP